MCCELNNLILGTTPPKLNSNKFIFLLVLYRMFQPCSHFQAEPTNNSKNRPKTGKSRPKTGLFEVARQKMKTWSKHTVVLLILFWSWVELVGLSAAKFWRFSLLVLCWSCVRLGEKWEAYSSTHLLLLEKAWRCCCCCCCSWVCCCSTYTTTANTIQLYKIQQQLDAMCCCVFVVVVLIIVL